MHPPPPLQTLSAHLSSDWGMAGYIVRCWRRWLPARECAVCSPPRPLVRVPVGAPASSHQDSLTIPRSCSPAAPRMRLPDVSALRRGSRAALPRRQSTVARLDIAPATSTIRVSPCPPVQSAASRWTTSTPLARRRSKRDARMDSRSAAAYYSTNWELGARVNCCTTALLFRYLEVLDNRITMCRSLLLLLNVLRAFRILIRHIQYESDHTLLVIDSKRRPDQGDP